MTKIRTKKSRLRRIFLLGLALIAFSIAASAVAFVQKEGPRGYWEADWSSTGRLPAAAQHRPAMVRIFAARTGRWKGIFAVHTWIVIKDKDGQSYQRFDKVGWGQPVRVNNWPPDGRWYSNTYETIFAADGPGAEKLIPAIRAAVRAYPYNRYGSYKVWPGPNSNTFTACVIAATPGLRAVLPPTAVGKDYPCGNSWFSPTPTRTGYRLSLGGTAGITAGWLEGFEINILGAVIGFDLRRPALKLPGIGRIGMPVAS